MVGRAFDGTGKQDGFNLDVVSLTLSKPLDEGQWSAGYVAQLWFGPDAVGFNTSPGGGGDLAVKQAYINLRAPIGNGLDIRIGHFNYIGGYEYPDAADNPNYSRSYAWTMEPASHTGVLLNYKVNDVLSLAAGVANTFNNGINWRAARPGGLADESEKTYMASFTLTAPESFGSMKGATLSATVVNGLNNVSGSGGSFVSPTRISCFQVGGTIPTPLQGLSVGASYDYEGRDSVKKFPGTSVYVNAATLYVLYQATEKLKLNTRAEYTSASAGYWNPLNSVASGSNDEFFGLTATADYSLWANVVTRAELRWDSYVSGGPHPFGLAANPDKNAVSLALNVIYKF